MINEILNFTSSNRVEQLYLEKYNRYENLFLNTHLFNKSCEDHIEELKKRFEEESDDLILLVVEYILPKEKPDNLPEEIWKTYQENYKNIWGFKILNPKNFHNERKNINTS